MAKMDNLRRGGGKNNLQPLLEGIERAEYIDEDRKLILIYKHDGLEKWKNGAKVRNAGPKYVLSTSVLHYLETVYITWLDMPVCNFVKKNWKIYNWLVFFSFKKNWTALDN